MRVCLLLILLAGYRYDGDNIKYLLELIALFLGYFKFRYVRVALIIDLVLAHARSNDHLLIVDPCILCNDGHLVNEPVNQAFKTLLGIVCEDFGADASPKVPQICLKQLVVHGSVSHLFLADCGQEILQRGFYKNQIALADGYNLFCDLDGEDLDIRLD